MKKTLLLLHGALSSKAQFNKFTDLLEDLFDVHCLNLSGHGGESSGNEMSMTQFGKDIQQYIQERQLSDVYVFGYSMGGYAALHLEQSNPGTLKKIMTLGTKLDWSEKALSGMLTMFNTEIIEQKVPKLAQGLAALHAPSDWKTVVNNTAIMLKHLSNAEAITDDSFKNIQCPVMLCVGAEDHVVSVEETQHVSTLIPEAKLEVIPEFPHPFEKTDQPFLASLIKEFLN